MAGPHVVIVGAGVGGLVSAALLAARGQRVTVVEARDQPGGKLRALPVNGRAIDAGPTVFTMKPLMEEIFAEAGGDFDDAVMTTPATVLARHAWGDDRLDLFADPLRSEDAIGDFAGAQAARGYRDFRRQAARVYDTLDASFLRAGNTNPIGLSWRVGMRRFPDMLALRPYESLWKVLGDYFADPRLRQLFARYATYCGSSPFRAPSTLMLIAHVEALGVWLIEGGMHALAGALETLARRNGALFRYGSAVDEIVIEHGRACGVTLAGGERIAADAVICNADPAALGSGRFGRAAAAACRPTKPAQRSLSAMVWLAEARAGGFPLARHTVLFSRDYPSEFAALHAGRLADEPSVYICAQDRDDAGAAPDGPERLQIIVNAPPTGDAGHPTPAEIERCCSSMQDTLARAGLSLALRPEATRLLTPADFEAMCPSTGGGLYGRASHGWAASFLRQSARTRIPGLYCAGGSTHPGAGVPMAALSGRLAAATLLKDRAFDVAVAPGGYAWWYIDACSEDGRYGLTIIAFVGSVFSPYYAWSRRRDPEDHCTLNVSLYGRGSRRWAMTERRRGEVSREPTHLQIGPSAVRWDRDALTIDIAEVGAPIPQAVRGRVRVYPEMLGHDGFALDPAGRHRWHPIAPRARIEVEMDKPSLRWSGSAYLDSNFGDEALADGFRDWNWSRAHLGRDVAVMYEGVRRDDSRFELALRFDAQGRWHEAEMPPAAPLPRTLFAMPRTTRADRGHSAKVIKTWEDAPFYSRSLVSTRLFGEDVHAIHESLAMDRFRSPLVLAMLPYKMPRVSPWSILAGPVAPFLAR